MVSVASGMFVFIGFYQNYSWKKLWCLKGMSAVKNLWINSYWLFFRSKYAKIWKNHKWILLNESSLVQSSSVRVTSDSCILLWHFNKLYNISTIIYPFGKFWQLPIIVSSIVQMCHPSVFWGYYSSTVSFLFGFNNSNIMKQP